MCSVNESVKSWAHSERGRLAFERLSFELCAVQSHLSFHFAEDLVHEVVCSPIRLVLCLRDSRSDYDEECFRPHFDAYVLNTRGLSNLLHSFYRPPTPFLADSADLPSCAEI